MTRSELRPALREDVGTIDELKRAARLSNCTVDLALAQMAHIVGPLVERRTDLANTYNLVQRKPDGTTKNQGICTGLCATWLDLLQRGEQDTFKDKMTGQSDELLESTVVSWRGQKNAGWGPSSAMKAVTKQDSKTLKNFLAPYDKQTADLKQRIDPLTRASNIARDRAKKLELDRQITDLESQLPNVQTPFYKLDLEFPSRLEATGGY